MHSGQALFQLAILARIGLLTLMHTGYTRPVTIPEAVSTLRKRADLDQPALAALAQTTVETISRWERGHRAPSPEALKKLAAIAESKGQPELGDVFESKWKARIAGRIKNLPSSGTQRRVSVEDLKYWPYPERYGEADRTNAETGVR